MWRVVIERGSRKGKSFKLKGDGSLSIGRSRRNGITLEDQLISRLHCRLEIQDESLEIQDCGSHNGTHVNHRAVQKASLQPGDLITVGETDLSVYKSDAADPLVGKDIQGYQVKERIGRGGGGTVYLAEQMSMKRSVAIKVFPEEKSDQPKALRKFLEEAKLSAQLNHPHLVGIHDIVEAEDICFFSMDYMSGGSLGEKAMRSRTLSIDEVVDYLIQACEGLSYLHEKGLIHRDIKPANLMLDGEGKVRIGDFGITIDQRVATGKITGSPHFMSPEQARGQELDPRSDLYSLGCTAFRLLSGMPPFIGGSMEAVLKAHVNEKPPKFKDAVSDLSPILAKVFDRLLCKDPSKRYQTTEELVSALKGAGQGV